MDGFSYNNIFDTKGIEYLIIIAFLLLLIPFWLALNKQVKIKEQFRKAIGALSAGILSIPQGIFFSKNHTWAYLEKSGTAKVGVDDLLLHITGELNINQLKNPGDRVRKGELMAQMDQGGKSLKVFSPISGTIVHSNPDLATDPCLLNQDPYGQGWLYNIKPSLWVEEIPAFLLADDATQWLNQELIRYKDFLALNMKKYSPDPSMVVLQDGGELSVNSLSGMPVEMWQNFQDEFLTPS
jgi:glycine cleavage system H protein